MPVGETGFEATCSVVTRWTRGRTLRAYFEAAYAAETKSLSIEMLQMTLEAACAAATAYALLRWR